MLDGTRRYQVDDRYALALPHAVDTGNPLLQHRRVPRNIQVHHPRSGLQVEADPSGIGR